MRDRHHRENSSFLTKMIISCFKFPPVLLLCIFLLTAKVTTVHAKAACHDASQVYESVTKRCTKIQGPITYHIYGYAWCPYYQSSVDLATRLQGFYGKDVITVIANSTGHPTDSNTTEDMKIFADVIVPWIIQDAEKRNVKYTAANAAFIQESKGHDTSPFIYKHRTTTETTDGPAIYVGGCDDFVTQIEQFYTSDSSGVCLEALSQGTSASPRTPLAILASVILLLFFTA